MPPRTAGIGTFSCLKKRESAYLAMEVAGKNAVFDIEGQRQIARKDPTARQLRAQDEKQADNIENPTVDVSARTLVSETWQSWWESPMPIGMDCLGTPFGVPILYSQTRKPNRPRQLV